MFKILIIFVVYTNICYSKDKNIKNKTIIESDKIILKDRKKMILFSGNVICRNGNITIKADNMSVKYDKKLNSGEKVKIEDIYANENVKLDNGKMTVTGDKGNYDLTKEIITIEKNVVMNNDSLVMLGEKLTYNIKTDDAKMDGIKNQNKLDKRVIIILDDINKLKDEYNDRK